MVIENEIASETENVMVNANENMIWILCCVEKLKIFGKAHQLVKQMRFHETHLVAKDVSNERVLPTVDVVVDVQDKENKQVVLAIFLFDKGSGKDEDEVNVAEVEEAQQKDEGGEREEELHPPLEVDKQTSDNQVPQQQVEERVQEGTWILKTLV